MKAIRDLIRLLCIAALLLLTACGGSFVRYTDGPLTQYLTEPIPRLSKPIATTLSVQKVEFMTASNMKAVMIGDLPAREIYLMPEDVGREVKAQLNLEDRFSEEATYNALNTIAKNRAKARHIRGGHTAGAIPLDRTADASTQQYVQRQEGMAAEARAKGNYLAADIHTSAATNALMIRQSFGRVQATADLAFSVFGAMAALGEGFIKEDFIKLRNWLEFKSGAIDAQVREGNHLSVFLLQFFDAKSFQLDSRNRVAVFMTLTDKNGDSKSVLEGSDILVCEGECNLFKPKPTAVVFEKNGHSADVQKQLSTSEGYQYLTDNGFGPLSGFYQYILLQHGLQKLSIGVR